jgi:hypothetical protein
LLGGIQVFLLVMGGCSAVYRAMLRDYDTRMLESHRLTPMSNSAVTLGYLVGANLQVLALCGLMAAFGTVLCFVARVSAEPWLVGNLIVLLGASTLWAMTTFGGLRPAKPVNPSGILVGAGIFGSVWFFVIPGAGLMLGAYATAIGATIMWGQVTPTLSVTGLLCGLHLFLTVFWLMVAADKYRRPDLPALNGARGLVFLAIWLLVGTIGVVLFHPVANNLGVAANDFVDVDVLWSLNLGASVLVALIPISGAVECRVLAQRGASMRGASDKVPSLLVTFLATVMIVGALIGLGYPTWPGILRISASLEAQTRLAAYSQTWGPTLLAVLTALLSARAVFVIGHALLRSPKWLVTLFVIAFWALPPLGDLIVSEALREYGRKAGLTWVFGSSPAGTIAIVWNSTRAVLWPGLLVQCGLALVLTLLAHGLSARKPPPLQGVGQR